MPNTFACEKVRDNVGPVFVQAIQKTQRVSVLKSQFVTQMQLHKYTYRTADSEHCSDLSGLISAVGVTGIYSRQYIAQKFFACGL